MESYKQEKIIVIMYEYTNDNREFYPISNVPLAKAKFFYKDDTGLFKLMAVSDYTVKTELNESRLYIINEDIKEKSSKFQIGYEINFKAAEYESPLPVLSVLVTLYNELVEDTRTLHNYIRKHCFIGDNKNQSLILPNLPADCVWCMGENGNMFALPVSDLYEGYEKMVQKVYEDTFKLLKKDKDDMSDELREETNILLDELKTLKKELATALNTLTEDKKEEINNYKDNTIIPEINDYLIATSKPSIDKHVEEKKVELNKYIEENKSNLKGEKGDKGDRGETGPIGPKGDSIKGDKGDKGEQGNTGIVIPIAGQYALEVELNGDLYVVYPDETEPPKFTLEENGDLFLEID